MKVAIGLQKKRLGVRGKLGDELITETSRCFCTNYRTHLHESAANMADGLPYHIISKVYKKVASGGGYWISAGGEGGADQWESGIPPAPGQTGGCLARRPPAPAPSNWLNTVQSIL